MQSSLKLLFFLQTMEVQVRAWPWIFQMEIKRMVGEAVSWYSQDFQSKQYFFIHFLLIRRVSIIFLEQMFTDAVGRMFRTISLILSLWLCFHAKINLYLNLRRNCGRNGILYDNFRPQWNPWRANSKQLATFWC